MAAALILSSVSCSSAEIKPFDGIKPTVGSWSSTNEKYASLLETYEGNTCSGAYVVATDSDIVYLYCEDSVEKDGTTPVSQDTVYDIASVSKTFTAVAILQLAEQGKLSLDDTLGKYFPEYETGKDITVYDLLHMRTGIPDYMNNPDPFWDISGAEAANQKLSDILQDRTTDEEFLQALYNAPLLSEPGTEYAYSNTNYRLLAFIIEQITGMKYCDYVKKNIFDKCGMKKTTSMAVGDMTYVPGEYNELVEYGFTDENGYPVCPNNCRGDGGIHSCLSDMISFDRALFGGMLLNEKSMEILLTDEDGYCCGLSKDKNGYSHDGSSLTCYAKNKIIGSEEFGNVYVITLERTVDETADEEGADPMAGTDFTPGSVSDGVYINEYAGIRMTIPEGFEQFSGGGPATSSMSCTDEKDRILEAAKYHDFLFYDGNGSGKVIEFVYLNTKLGAPDDSDYTENDYLDDYTGLMQREGAADEDGWTLEEKGREKVTLGGREYVREKVELDYHGKTDMYYYARKLDDRLMCIILLSGADDDSLADYEKLITAAE